MGIDIVDRVSSKAGVGKRLLYGLDRAFTRRMGIGNAITAQRVAIAGQLRGNVSASRAGGLPFFEHEKAGAFAENKTIARGVERAAGVSRHVVVRGQRSQQAKAGQAKGMKHRVVAA